MPAPRFLIIQALPLGEQLYLYSTPFCCRVQATGHGLLAVRRPRGWASALWHCPPSSAPFRGHPAASAAGNSPVLQGGGGVWQVVRCRSPALKDGANSGRPGGRPRSPLKGAEEGQLFNDNYFSLSTTIIIHHLNDAETAAALWHCPPSSAPFRGHPAASAAGNSPVLQGGACALGTLPNIYTPQAPQLHKTC